MPTCFHNIPIKKLSRFSLLVIFILSPLFFLGQSLSGLWTGVMTNDSTSIRKDQSFEIALTEYKGKVYGYSRSEFIVNDTLYYIVKRVKGTIEGDKCEVKDDEIISCNFQKRLEKGVKVSSTFYRNKQDSAWYLAGKWKTTQTKNYYSVTGKVALQEEKDLSKSKIFPHLEELNLANDVAFYKERQKQTVALQTAVPDNKRFESLIKTEEQSLLKNGTLDSRPDVSSVDVNTVSVNASQTIHTNATPVNTGSVGIPVKTDANIASAELKDGPERLKTNIKPEEQSIVNKPAASNKPAVNNISTNTVTVAQTQVMRTNTEPVKTGTTSVPVKTDANIAKAEIKPVVEKPKTVIKPQEQTTVKNNPSTPDNKSVAVNPPPINTVKNESKQVIPATPVERKPIEELTNTLTAGRKSEFSQVVNFRSDSLELALYDNGEIDGDTVSVYMNGQVILSQQCLKASAIKKTIYITPGNEEFTLVLFAENLGKYPPNTGLLVVHDGDDVYNIRFSADLSKNAGLVFRRKSN